MGRACSIYGGEESFIQGFGGTGDMCIAGNQTFGHSKNESCNRPLIVTEYRNLRNIFSYSALGLNDCGSYYMNDPVAVQSTLKCIEIIHNTMYFISNV